jgi:hypothetical protein
MTGQAGEGMSQSDSNAFLFPRRIGMLHGSRKVKVFLLRTFLTLHWTPLMLNGDVRIHANGNRPRTCPYALLSLGNPIRYIRVAWGVSCLSTFKVTS